MNANIMKIPFSINVTFKFMRILIPSDLITTLTYVLMDNFVFIFIIFFSRTKFFFVRI